MRMRGYNVLFPIGFDAFGLPAENAAIKPRHPPREWTYVNIERMRGQLRQMGAMFDFDAEVVTCDPEYYRWNQWFFLSSSSRAWRTARGPRGLVPEGQHDAGTGSRSSAGQALRAVRDAGHKEVPGAVALQITDYAEELLDFTKMDWPERVKTLQRNWIGRSEGAEIYFQVEGYGPIEVFTTRPDTLFGATFFVLAPEHPAVEQITTAGAARTRSSLRREGRAG